LITVVIQFNVTILNSILSLIIHRQPVTTGLVVHTSIGQVNRISRKPVLLENEVLEPLLVVALLDIEFGFTVLPIGLYLHREKLLIVPAVWCWRTYTRTSR